MYAAENCLLCGKLLLNQTCRIRNYKMYHKGISVLSNDKFANKVIKMIDGNIKQSDFVIENYPGGGLITKELMRKNITTLAFEPRNEYYEKLLESQYTCNSENIHIVNEQPYKTDTLLFSNKKIQSIMDKLQIKECDTLSVIGVCDILPMFIGRTAMHFLKKQGYYSFSKLHIYLILNGEKYHNISPSQNKFQNILLSNLIFTPKCLLKFSQVDMEASDKDTDKKVSFDSTYFEKDHWYLIELIPNTCLYDLCEEERLPGLYYFCKQLFSRKAGTRLIPQLEQWCPDVGIDVIKAGYDMMQYPKDLSIQDFIQIYKIFAASPEFKDSVFWHMVNEQMNLMSIVRSPK